MVPEPRPAGHELTTAWVDVHSHLMIHVLRPRPRTVLVRVAGEIDLDTARKLDEVLRSGVDGDVDEVVVDLAAVTFFSVAGLNSLLRARLLADTAGAHLTIDGQHSHAVRRLFGLLPLELDGVSLVLAAR
jgi:anti-sigma B factor antagonist